MPTTSRAIATRSGGYQGVGFAIPINMARKIMDSLISNGKVVRGWLGVSLQDLNEDMADALDLRGRRGALVGQVMDNSPASRAGMRQGDLITAFEGHEVRDVKDLRLRVIDQAPGTQVRLQVTRDGKEITIPVKLGELENDGQENEQSQMEESDSSTRSSDLGMALQDLTARTRQQLDLPGDVDGVLVVDVERAKAAGRAGLRPEDVILKVGDKAVTSVRAVERALGDVPTGKSALLLVRRENAEIFLAIRMPEK
jgi:serine protease Do